MMAGSTGGSSTAILESTTAENIRDAFYNNSDLSLSDEDSIQLREQYNILDVDFARVGSGRGLNLNTLQITSENEDGSVDVFDVVGQYSSFGTSSVEYLVLGAGWEGNGETYRIVTEVESGTMSGDSGSDLLVASDHQDGMTMDGGAGSNVLVGAVVSKILLWVLDMTSSRILMEMILSTPIALLSSKEGKTMSALTTMGMKLQMECMQNMHLLMAVP